MVRNMRMARRFRSSREVFADDWFWEPIPDGQAFSRSGTTIRTSPVTYQPAGTRDASLLGVKDALLESFEILGITFPGGTEYLKTRQVKGGDMMHFYMVPGRGVSGVSPVLFKGLVRWFDASLKEQITTDEARELHDRLFALLVTLSNLSNYGNGEAFRKEVLDYTRLVNTVTTGADSASRKAEANNRGWVGQETLINRLTVPNGRIAAMLAAKASKAG